MPASGGPHPVVNILMIATLAKAKKSGFTLVELVIVIVVLGILSAVAIPRFFDFSGDANEAATKGALGGVRSAIANSFAFSATPSGGGVATYPSLTDLVVPGTVMAQAIPDNPYVTGGGPMNTVADGTGVTRGTATGDPWVYNPVNGEFWAGTSSGAGEADF